MAWYAIQIFVNVCIKICEHTHLSSPTHICSSTHSGRNFPGTLEQEHNGVHLIWADSGPVCSSQSSLPAVCLKVRASSQLQQLNIKLAAAASPRAQLTQSIALHYSWGRRGPMRWPLTEGWISTVPNFTGAGGRMTPSTTAYRQRKWQREARERARNFTGEARGGVWICKQILKANLYFFQLDCEFDMLVWRQTYHNEVLFK